MSDKPLILIVDDETNVRRVLATLLEQEGFAALRAASGAQALDLVRAQDPDLVLTDLKMEGMDGMELLGRLTASFPEIPVLMLTAHGTVENAVEAMRRGAHDFLTKPFDRARVIAVVRQALEQAKGRRLEHRGPLTPTPHGLVGSAPAMRKLQQLIEKVGPTPATVLIQGETGTGKELVAEGLHRSSKRSAGPLVKINCGAIPQGLMEAELFGYERGAFTGADRAKPGRFELAGGGTLFLDEIGELPLEMQVKLLRVIEQKIVERVGGVETRPLDVRLIVATHRKLEEEVKRGAFREDLYFRIKVVVLEVAPLRERLEDLPGLVECFLNRQAERLEVPRPTISEDALAALAEQPWPGNVRELENAVERAVLLAEGPVLTAEDFGLAPRAGSTEEAGSTLKEISRQAAAAAERRMIRAALDTHGGNVTHAAARLGLSRRGLQLKMKEFGLRRKND